MKGRSGEVMAVAVLFFVLTWVTVALRVYVRAILLNNWGKDDWAIAVTLALFTVYLAFQMVAAVRGTGQHRWDLTDEDARIALLFWYLCELLYVLSNCTLKMALGIFYLRVAMQRWHIWCIKLLMAGTVLFGLIYFFLVMFQCIPVSEFWKNHPASSKCIPKAPTLGITYALGVVNACADWAFGILPFFIVWDLHMNLKTRLLVAGILAFAAIGSTGTIVRMKYIHTLTNGPDFLWATTDVATWSTVEPGIGITACSLATLRPLLQQFLGRIGFASHPTSGQRRYRNPSSRSSQKRSDRRGYRRSLDITDLVPTENGTTLTTITGPEPPPKDVPGLPTPPALTAPNRNVVMTEERRAWHGQIMQSVVVEQEYEGPPRLQLRDSLRNSFTRGSILQKSSK